MSRSTIAWSILFLVGQTVIADDGDDTFVWNSISSSDTNPSSGTRTKSAFLTGRTSSFTPTNFSAVRSRSLVPERNPNDRSFLTDLIGQLGLGSSQTSLENNVLNIQSSNTKFSSANFGGGNQGFINNGPGIFDGPPPPVAPPINQGFISGPNQGFVSGGPPPRPVAPGQFLDTLAPMPIPAGCECARPGDCRTVGQFARTIKRMNQNFCMIGSVLCCSDPRGPVGIGGGRPLPPPPPGMQISSQLCIC